jgi:hypothetical protein
MTLYGRYRRLGVNLNYQGQWVFATTSPVLSMRRQADSRKVRREDITMALEVFGPPDDTLGAVEHSH